LPAFSLIIWGAFSSAIIMINKRVYAGGFPYPCALTSVGSGFSALAALAAARLASALSGGDGGRVPEFLRLRSARELFYPQQQRPEHDKGRRRSQRQREIAADAAAAASAADAADANGGVDDPEPQARPTSLVGWVAPVAVATALSMALGNFPYLYLGVAFIQMLKASAPAWTLLLAAAAGLERVTPALAGSVALIAAGTAATVVFERGGGVVGGAGGAGAGGAGGGAGESGGPSAAGAAAAAESSASAFGVALTLLSCVTEAARVVGSQALLQKQQQQQRRQGGGQQKEKQENGRAPAARGACSAGAAPSARAPAAGPPAGPPPPPPLNALETLAYVGAPASLLLLLASLALREGGSPAGLLRAARAFARARPGTAAAAVASSALVNFTSMAAVRLTSSLTFKVSGCAKNAAVVALAAAEHGDRVAPGQMLGYAVATAGFVAYAVVKGRQEIGRAGAGGRRRGGAALAAAGAARGDAGQKGGVIAAALLGFQDTK